MKRYAPSLPNMCVSSRPGSLDGCAGWKGRGTLGFGLFETILSLVLMVALSLVAVALWGPTTSASAVHLEGMRLDALAKNIPAAYVSGVDYAGLTQNPPQVPGFQSNLSVWQQPFSVLPTTELVLDDAWQVTYQGAPPDTCAKLGEGEWRKDRWYSIRVDGKAVSDPTSLAKACSTPVDPSRLHELQFVAYDGTRPNATSGLAPLCFDRTREDVAAGHADPGCPNNPADYLPSSIP